MKTFYWRKNIVWLGLWVAVSLAACGRESDCANTSIQTSVIENLVEVDSVAGVVEKDENGWGLMEMHHNSDDMCDNGFPIAVTLQDGRFELAISCEGCDKRIVFDATKHYEQMKSEQENWGFPVYDSYMDGNFQVGDSVGSTSAYGIWNIEVGTYENQKCLIAEHGLNGPTGKYDFYGCAYVYFAYDEKAKIKILDLEFKEAVEEEE